ncbi:hypothetical protein AJ80_01881 [Polytolypa hystricis UAMH7299]|uniref:Ubiquitin 3 binding protein But2 C-terminal domain-containing protein n=1 Tax=Polytolypa hystricis (strain UAMH7299) TaxID=1447883 RepID=A0A2B7YZJ3_POLH7|nr:hypothetical protein AJ80_01881 [Polytolypa hystricis UAMH7299]
MQFLKSIHLSLLALVALTSALPAPELAERASPCTTVLPAIARVDEARPVESYLPGFKISQDNGATNRNDVFAEFTIPAGSWGCTLQYSFSAGYSLELSGQTAVEVYAVPGPLNRSPHGIDVSWDYCPAPLYQVGSVNFETSATQTTTRTINSFACAQTMTYRFTIADWSTQAGNVEFEQKNDAGLRMVYGC